jgi:hypothetical protein
VRRAAGRAAVILSRLVGAWVLVAACWLFVAGVAARLGVRGFSRRLSAWRCAEALLCTMFGSLWFASLGSGEWWLLFGVVGALVAGGTASTRATLDTLAVLEILIDILRYVVAGGILAALLG